MLTLKHACLPRPSVFDSTKRDTVHDLLDLIENRLDPSQFFEENYATQGMRTLLDEAFKRLEGGAQAQGVFRLSQSMGGGKTHNLLALGLLAKHPELREAVMNDFHKPAPSLGKVRVAAFSGRQTDSPYGIWGEIAKQLGKEKEFAPYYAPLAAPGQQAWINLLQGEPLVILLDELPPYYNYARTREIGTGTLADVTTAALSNLMIAVSDNKLHNVVLVLTDLAGASYAAAQQQINTMLQSVQDLNSEATRLSTPIDPVRMNTDEFYHILRTRLFAGLPATEEIEKVAQAYGQAIKQAKQQDLTTASPEQFAADIVSSYPFHPAIRDLYARFRENSGFQQTRALIRIMRIIVAELWGGAADGTGKADGQYLIAAHDFNLTNAEMVGEIRQINSKLDNAVAHDIEDTTGSSVAQRLDAETRTTNGLDVCRLLYLASLSTSLNPVLGLNRSEIVAYLAAPERDIARLNKDALDRLQSEAWYIHITRDGRLYFKDVVNINAKLDDYTRAMLRDSKEKELRAQLENIFAVKADSCYQKLLLLPALSEIDLAPDAVTLVVFRPTETAIETIEGFYHSATLRNRVCFLTGDASAYERVLEAASRLRAIDAILKELRSDGKPDADPQVQEALGLLDKYRSNLYMAVKTTFLILYYPTKSEPSKLSKLDMNFTYAEHRFDGGEQIRKALAEAYKYTTEVSAESTFRGKVEKKLWPEGQQEIPWAQIKTNAAQDPSWSWHPMNALEQLKSILVQRQQWRESSGYVDKGPFPQPKTQVSVQVLGRDEETGMTTLRVRALHGDLIYMETGGAPATEASRLLDGDTVEVDSMNVSFRALDSSKIHEVGDSLTWKNEVRIKHRFYEDNGQMRCELKSFPPVKVNYTTDGADPVRNGGVYSSPFMVPKAARFVLAAPADGCGKTEKIDIPAEPNKPTVHLEKGYNWSRRFQRDSTMETFQFLAECQKQGAWLIGVGATISHERRWIELQLDGETPRSTESVRTSIETLRDLLDLKLGAVSLTVTGLNFETGQQLNDMVANLKTTLKPDEFKEIEKKT